MHINNKTTHARTSDLMMADGCLSSFTFYSAQCCSATSYVCKTVTIWHLFSVFMFALYFLRVSRYVAIFFYKKFIIDFIFLNTVVYCWELWKMCVFLEEGINLLLPQSSLLAFSMSYFKLF